MNSEQKRLKYRHILLKDFFPSMRVPTVLNMPNTSVHGYKGGKKVRHLSVTKTKLPLPIFYVLEIQNQSKLEQTI